MWSELVSNPRRGLRVFGLTLLTLGAGALALPSFGRMDMRGVNIIDVELMGTSARANELLAQLGPAGVDATRTSIYLDFPFLVLYALTLSAACVVLAARASDRGASSVASIGRKVAWAAPIAAAYDAVENVSLLVVLGGTTAQPWPVVAFVFAAAKFALLVVVVAYLVAAFVLDRRAHSTAP